MTNLYAPPRTVVEDIAPPREEIVLAPRGARLAAAILDSIVFMVMVYAPMMMAVLPAAAVDEDAVPAFAMIGLLLTVVGLIAFCVINIRYMARNGQSVGKKILGIKVVRPDGSPATLGRLIWLRNVVTWILNFIPLYGLIDVLFIFGETRQCLHDRIADTIVVQA